MPPCSHFWYRQCPPVIGVTLAEKESIKLKKTGEPFSKGVLKEEKNYVEKDAKISYKIIIIYFHFVAQSSDVVLFFPFSLSH